MLKIESGGGTCRVVVPLNTKVVKVIYYLEMLESHVKLHLHSLHYTQENIYHSVPLKLDLKKETTVVCSFIRNSVFKLKIKLKSANTTSAY